MKMIYACNLIERRGQVLRLASDSAVAAAVAAVSVDAADAVNAKRWCQVSDYIYFDIYYRTNGQAQRQLI